MNCCCPGGSSGSSGSSGGDCAVCEGSVIFPPSDPPGTYAPATITVNLSGWNFPALNDDHELPLETNSDFFMSWYKEVCSWEPGLGEHCVTEPTGTFPRWQYRILFYIELARVRNNFVCPESIPHRCYLFVAMNYLEDAAGLEPQCGWTCFYQYKSGQWELIDSMHNVGCDAGDVPSEYLPGCGDFVFYPPGQCIYQWVDGAWVLVVGTPDDPELVCGDPDCTISGCAEPDYDGTEEGEYGTGNAECECPCVCGCEWLWECPEESPPGWIIFDETPDGCCPSCLGLGPPLSPGAFCSEIRVRCCDDYEG